MMEQFNRAQELLGQASPRYERYHISGDPTDLLDAVEACEDVVDLLPDIRLEVSRLGELLDADDRDAIEHGVDELEVAARLLAAAALVALGQHDPEAVDPAIEHCERVVEVVDPLSVLMAEACKNWADALTLRYGRSGDPDDIVLAEAKARQAVRVIRDPALTWPKVFESASVPTSTAEMTAVSMVATLSGCLIQKCIVTQTLDAVDELVELCRDVLEVYRTASPVFHSKALGNLSIALRLLYLRTADSRVLDEAVQVAQRAVAVMPPNSASWVIFRRDLGFLQFLRFRRTSDRSDLDAAVDNLSAITHADDAISLPPMWSDLGLALLVRALLDGSASDFTRAFDAYAIAVDRSEPGVHRITSLTNLAYARRRAAFGYLERDGARTLPYYQLLERSVDTYRIAVREAGRSGMEIPPPTVSGLAFCLLELAGMPSEFRENVQMTGTERTELIALADRVPATSTASWPVEHGLFLEVFRAHAYALGQDWDAALAGFERALDRLRELAAIGIGWADVTHRMSFFVPFTSDAVVCAVYAGDSERAVRLIETGRALITTNLTAFRGDLLRLGRTAPELAARVRDHTAFWRQELGAGDVASRPLEESRLSDLLAEVRRQPGFRTFGRFRPRLDLETLRGHGPVIALAASQYGSAILVATADGVHARLLDDLPYAEVLEHGGKLVDVTSRLGEAPADELDNDLRAVLEWGWDRFGRPALDMCGFIGAPHGDDPLPRVWWCPLGPLSVLPVHAFGRAGESVLARAISSYSVSVIPQRERRLRTPIFDPDIVAIVVDSPPGHSPLPHAAREAEMLSRIHGRTIALRGATTDQAVRQLASADIAHFACHGIAAATAGELPGLLMQDGLLAVDEIAHRIQGRGDLAFASACSTAAGALSVPDEVLSVSAGLQSAGYEHVIGTLWSSADSLGPQLADAFYRQVVERTGVFDVTRSAEALHHAVKVLRTRIGDRPIFWASFVHYGW